MKKLFKLWRKRILFYLSSDNHFLFTGFYRFLYKPAPDSLSEFLDQYSKSLQECCLVQIGANDGMTHDPVHKFIKRDKWRGVLLEPQQDVFYTWLKPLYAQDEGIEVVNAALGKLDGVMPLYKIGFSKARWATGLASFRKEVVQKAFSSGHVHRQAKKEGIEIPPEPGKQIISEDIPVLSVATLMKKYDLEKIDLLQIDTEGFDYEIIKMFDLKQLPPRVIVYENMHLSETDRRACREYLKSHGYSIRIMKANTLAMQRPYGALKRFFK